MYLNELAKKFHLLSFSLLSIFCVELKSSIDMPENVVYQNLKGSDYSNELKINTDLLSPESTYLKLKPTKEYGLFSVFLMVLGGLDFYERGIYQGFEVDFADAGLYYEPRFGLNWWTYFFEPVVVGLKEKNEERELTIREAERAAYFARDRMSKNRAHMLINKYIKLKPDILEIIDRFQNEYFDSPHMIGVHYRGTDKITANEAKFTPYSMIYEAVLDHVNELGIDEFKIFVATDELAFLEYMLSQFPDRVVFQNAQRSRDGEPLHFDNPQPYEQGRETVIDSYLLSDCHFLIRTYSNLSICSTYLNPEISDFLVNHTNQTTKARRRNATNNCFLNLPNTENAGNQLNLKRCFNQPHSLMFPSNDETKLPFVIGSLSQELGNNMFQVATTCALAWDNGATPCFPDLIDSKDNWTSANYEHIFFRCSSKKPKSPIEFCWRMPTEFNFCYHPIPYKPNMKIEYGTFQTEKFFAHHRKEILDLFSPHPNDKEYIQSKYGETLKHPNLVGVQMRWFGRKHDQAWAKYLIQYGEDYFRQAMSCFPEDTLFLVSSNNIEFAKASIPLNMDNVIFLEDEPYYIDFHILSMCKHQIISNSTFGWWTAWLNDNPEKIVITPKEWIDPYWHFMTPVKDVWPEGWIQIDAKWTKPFAEMG